MRRIILLLATVALVAGLIFVSVAGAQKRATDGAQKRATDGAQTQATKRVLIQDFRFSPARITVERGTKVIWINKDNIGHTVTRNNGGFDSGILQKGERFTRTFRKVGKFGYHCEPHPTMRGTVIVKRRR